MSKKQPPEKNSDLPASLPEEFPVKPKQPEPQKIPEFPEEPDEEPDPDVEPDPDIEPNFPPEDPGISK